MSRFSEEMVDNRRVMRAIVDKTNVRRPQDGVSRRGGRSKRWYGIWMSLSSYAAIVVVSRTTTNRSSIQRGNIKPDRTDDMRELHK